MAYNSIKIVKGSGGYGGPLVITPTDEKHKFVYVTGGGDKPDIVDKIEELSGMESVNGFKTSIPDNEIALAIIDCGGTLRCGIYPKRIFQQSISSQRERAVRWHNTFMRIFMYPQSGKSDHVSRRIGSG